MNRVPLGLQPHKREFGREIELRLVNRFFEQNPVSAEGAALLSRPGSVPLGGLLGTAPYGNLYAKEGIFNGALFYTSADGFHKVGGAAMAGSSTVTTNDYLFVSYAAAAGIGYTHLFVAYNSALFLYDGTTFSAVASVPGDLIPNKVAHLGGFVVVTDLGGNQFWYIRPGEVTIDALDFESAESEADSIVDVLNVGDLLWFLGGSSIEAWYLSGDADRPIQRVPGMTHRIGAYAGGAASVQGTGFFVGSDNMVYMLDGTAPKRISTHTIEERVREAVQDGTVPLRAWGFVLDGHLFYVLTLSSAGTYVYDVLTQQWSRWKTEGDTYWNMVQGTTWGPTAVGVPLDGSAILSQEVGAQSIYDDADPIWRVVAGYVPHRARGGATNSLLRLYAGWADPEGSVVPETVALRFSDDGGSTWQGPFTLTLLGTEEQRQFEWRSLGKIGPAGRLFEITDSGGLVRIDGAYAQID